VTVRHQATTGLLRYFAWEHLPPDLQPISRACADLAEQMVDALPDGPELTTGLRKLLESKDCFVRAALPAPLEVDDHDSIFPPGAGTKGA
jgi:hypothetical protein